MDLAGMPLLARVMRRVSRASALDEVVVATTFEPQDDLVATLCANEGWACFRGSTDDVLDRYHQATSEHQADVVVRMTSDNPLADPVLVDQAVGEFMQGQPRVQYVSTSLGGRTFPLGVGVEVVRSDALRRAWASATSQPEREHVTPYIYGHPELFALSGLRCENDYSHHRWTVDTPEDLELIRRIFASFANDEFTWQQVLTKVSEHPEWARINSQVPQKTL